MWEPSGIFDIFSFMFSQQHVERFNTSILSNYLTKYEHSELPESSGVACDDSLHCISALIPTKQATALSLIIDILSLGVILMSNFERRTQCTTGAGGRGGGLINSLLLHCHTVTYTFDMRQPPRCLTFSVFAWLVSAAPAAWLPVWLTGCVDVSAVLIC